jgi:thiol-disulfide isomerase/thioredoxin
MIRRLLALALVASTFLSGYAQEDKKPAKPEASLKVGDPAPKLSVTKWLKGDAVNAFEPGKVYVVEFWATWCGPCIAAMPHVSELQAEFKSQGLTVIGVTSKDPNNSLDQVTEFIKNRGSIMEYTAAWCEDRATDAAFMKAAGQNGIPCSFVIDKQGNVAFIGHPLILDEVLPKVIAGTWNAKVDAEATSKILETTFKSLGEASRDPEKGLEIFAKMEKDTPRLAAQFADMKLGLLLKAKKTDEAEKVFGELLTKAVKKKDATKLTSISSTWSSPQYNADKKNLDLAVKAIDEAIKIAGDKDIRTMLTAAQVYDATGNKEKAAEYADKAVAAAPENVKERVKTMVEKYKK